MEELDSPSRKEIERNRRNVAAFRMRNQAGGVAEHSEAVLADPTEAWRTKVTGHVNKNPDRARQRAAADFAAALPKNPAMHGPAVAAFMSHPLGKRAAASIQMEAPQDAAARKAAKRLDALSAMASDIGAGFAQMQVSASAAKETARVHQKEAAPEPQPRSRRSRSVPAVYGRCAVYARYSKYGGVGGEYYSDFIDVKSVTISALCML